MWLQILLDWDLRPPNVRILKEDERPKWASESLCNRESSISAEIYEIYRFIDLWFSNFKNEIKAYNTQKISLTNNISIQKSASFR